MGATCSSCCCGGDRRASDVVLQDDDDAAGALQQKLLVSSDYDHDAGNGTMLTDDSRGNPYSHSDSRMKDSWPRPAVTPASGYTGYGDEDDDDDDAEHSRYEDGSDTNSELSASGTSGRLAWNLRETERDGGSFEYLSGPVDTDDDGDGTILDGIGSVPRLDRAISAAQSVRSVASDSYASTRELPTYESLLFADDAAAKSHSPTKKKDDEDADADEDDDLDDDEALDLDSTSNSQMSPPSASSFAESSSALASAARRTKRSY